MSKTEIQIRRDPLVVARATFLLLFISYAVLRVYPMRLGPMDAMAVLTGEAIITVLLCILYFQGALFVSPDQPRS